MDINFSSFEATELETALEERRIFLDKNLHMDCGTFRTAIQLFPAMMHKMKKYMSLQVSAGYKIVNDDHYFTTDPQMLPHIRNRARELALRHMVLIGNTMPTNGYISLLDNVGADLFYINILIRPQNEPTLPILRDSVTKLYGKHCWWDMVGSYLDHFYQAAPHG